MQDPLSHGAQSRERVAPNLYKRTRKGGQVSFEVIFRDADGRQRQRRLKAKTERDAIREARALLASRDGGERIVAAKISVSEFAETEWLPLIDSLAEAGRRSERGVALDRSSWSNHVEPVLGDRVLGAVDGADVAGLLRDVRARGLSEATVANVLRVVRAIYRLARVRKVVTRSPVDELDPSELPRPRPARNQRRLDELEVDALVRHAPESYRAAIALLAFTGARVSEVIALQWRHVDFVDLEIRVEQQLTRATREKPAEFAPRKGEASAYAAVLFPALEGVLVERLASEQAAGRGGDDDLVVSTRAGRPLIQRNLAKAVEDTAKAAGLGDDVTPHVLRRSFASLAARRGVDPVQAARMTGHSLGTWTRFYASDYGKAQRDEARARMLEAGFGTAAERPSP